VVHRYVLRVEVRQCVRQAVILEAILAVVHLRLEVVAVAHVDKAIYTYHKDS
jgi:hypothetical protein